jgi:hypothetical protein
MPLARLLRAAPPLSDRSLPTGPQPEAPAAGLADGLERLLEAAFDSCFHGELDTDWGQLAASSPGPAPGC